MEKLIPLINKLQDALGTINAKLDLQLPQIVVVGSQSSGKSSVLESIVGKDFLPRGSGIVTRRPLVLQLKQIHTSEEYGVFGHKPEEKFKDFNRIRREIEEETERTVGKNANISKESIFLKIYSPNVLDVTLVDLPGVTKNPVGDQPADIEFQIRDMILSFITNPNSIILAVSNGNQDLANSDSLKLAREIDPHGERTLGVITKIDIMDKGTDAMEMLKGRLYPLKLGYVGVVCRSQEDINNNKPISKHLETEKIFFSTHPSYRTIAGKLGTPYLTQKLNKVLMHHIKKVLPDLKNKVNEMLRTNEEQLKTYGLPMENNPDLQGILMLNIITSYSTYFGNLIEGRSIQEDSEHLEGGAKIREILLRKFIHQLKSIEALDALEDSQIREAIDSATGVKSNFFVSEAAFELLLKMEIKRLVDPSLTIMQEVYEELRNLTLTIGIPESERFPNLKDSVVAIVQKVLSDCLVPTEEFIKNFMDIQVAYINTSIADRTVLNEVMKKAEEEADKEIRNFENRLSIGGFQGKLILNGSTDVDEDEKNKIIEVFTVKNLVKYHFDLIKKTVGDYVPKSVMSFLVIKSKEKIQNELISQLYNKEKFDELFFENSDIPYKRKVLTELQNSLYVAAKILSEVRDFDVDVR